MSIQELLLYGQVPYARQDQVLKILAGVAAHQPVRVLQRHILYRPVREPEEPGSSVRRGGTQDVVMKQTKAKAAPAVYYTKLIQQLSLDDIGAKTSTDQTQAAALSAHVADGEDAKWFVRWDDVPDTGDRGVSIRSTNTTELRAGDPHAWMIGVGPNRSVVLQTCANTAKARRFIKEYYVEGYRYTLGNVVIFLHRILHDLSEPGFRCVAGAPKVELPTFAELRLLDKSGTYLLEAKVRVQEFNNTAVLEGGVNELKAFQAQMKGCVDLSLADRLAMDTRVKYRAPQSVA